MKFKMYGVLKISFFDLSKKFVGNHITEYGKVLQCSIYFAIHVASIKHRLNMVL